MPPSQLKRLKASLREQGLTGPQKSKKQKKSLSKNADQHAKKAAALAGIRESFNPFEFRHLARPKKHDYVSNRPEDAKTRILGRPGVTKSQGEETRRKTLLPEMSRKNKVGGILDRRIGEGDPTMSVEDKMMARFEQEQQRKRGGNAFDLEDDDDQYDLTHGGQTLQFDEDDLGKEDYDAASVSGSSDDEEGGFLKKKRRRDSDEEGIAEADAPEQPERKKSKAEVMKEVIAKSKFHKYERQQLKEDDDDLREELDKEVGDVLAALRGHMNKQAPVSEPPREVPQDFGINPDRAAMLEARDQEAADKEYDARVRKMIFDQKSKPTERTKTLEEKAAEEAEKLRSLEEKRMRRMRGDPTSDDEDDTPLKPQDEHEDMGMDEIHDDAATFGLAAPIEQNSRPRGVDDEDDFLLDDDLIASDSEADMASGDESEDGSEVDDTMAADDEYDDFLDSLKADTTKHPKPVNRVLTIGPDTSSKLAFTYACPRSHEELLKVFEDVAVIDLPTAVQRVRALYHSGLHADNKEKLADFGCALVDHVSYLSNQSPAAPLSVIDSLIRHIHSLSRVYPAVIATQFREHLKKLHASNDPTTGDLTILTAFGSIYPTSDHFHQVVTPAITLMARWLGLTTPTSTKDIATGAFLSALCLHYQSLSKRYIPELIRYTLLCLESPHTTPALLTSHTQNILTAATLWTKNPSFTEIFTPLLRPLLTTRPPQKATHHRLTILLHSSRQSRRPQLLHNHRALPIKSNFPKFEESFDPTKHYDPDKERAEAAKLRKEYKREKKGAMRELRKDANFIAREKLRDKKEKDRKYVEKEKRLIAEIQGEGARDRNEWEREKRRGRSKK